MKRRTRKLTVEKRKVIYNLYNDNHFKMKDIAEIFGVSVPRISQIVKEFNDGAYDEE